MHLESFIGLSLTSLLLVNLLPLLLVVYRGRRWYDPLAQSRANFAAVAVAILIFIAVIYLAWTEKSSLSFYSGQLTLLHLLPLLVTTLIATSVANQNLGRQRNTTGDATSPAPITPDGSRVENLSWNDVVISEDLKRELQSVIVLLKDASSATRYGIEAPKGILLNGPPGTGKTTIAKVMASMAGMSFFVLKLDQVISQWVGESEKNLTRLFNAAEKSAPAIIFIDEIDSIGKSRAGQVQWADNLLNHLLQLMDGVIKGEGVYILAATNRAELVDDALKRPGRLNRVIEIGLPDEDSRLKLFQLHASKLNLVSTISLPQLATITAGKSGADIKEICNQAGLNAFQRESATGKREYTITALDMEKALQQYGVNG